MVCSFAGGCRSRPATPDARSASYGWSLNLVPDRAFATVSGDLNPLHHEGETAASSRFEVVSMVVLLRTAPPRLARRMREAKLLRAPRGPQEQCSPSLCATWNECDACSTGASRARNSSGKHVFRHHRECLSRRDIPFADSEVRSASAWSVCCCIFFHLTRSMHAHSFMG